MVPQSALPNHPDPDQLKRQAKELLRSAKARDPVSLARFRLLPAFRDLGDEQLARRRLHCTMRNRPSPASTASLPGKR